MSRSRSIDSRVRAHGRFWRAIRRIDQRSIDLPTITVRLILLALCALCIIAMSGCANYATIELAHSSHPLDGPPFGPRSEEDSLDRVNACLGRERSGWYVDSCLGYRYVDGGFAGSNFTFDARVGRKFRFGGLE